MQSGTKRMCPPRLNLCKNVGPMPTGEPPINRQCLYQRTNHPAECLSASALRGLLVTRRIANGDIAMSAFVIDVFCLGVEDAMFTVLP